MIEFLLQYKEPISIWLAFGTLFGIPTLPLLLEEYPNEYRDWSIRHFIFGGLAFTVFLGAIILFYLIYYTFLIGQYGYKNLNLNNPSTRFSKFMNYKPFQRRIK